MGKFSDRLGKWDDRNVIYRADDPEQKVHWRRAGLSVVVAEVVAGIAMAVTLLLVPKPQAYVILMVGIVMFLVSYVIWRRRRNRRLTGSPDKWPSDGDGAETRTP